MNWLASPPVALAIFLGLTFLFFYLVGRRAPRGADTPGKLMTYTGGEDLEPSEERLSYQRFFRLALVFVVAHIAALVVALLPRDNSVRTLGTVYLLGLALCLDVLIIRRDRDQVGK